MSKIGNQLSPSRTLSIQQYYTLLLKFQVSLSTLLMVLGMLVLLGRAFGRLIMNFDRIYVNRSLNIDFVNFAFTAKILVFRETLKNMPVLGFLSFQVLLDFNIFISPVRLV